MRGPALKAMNLNGDGCGVSMNRWGLNDLASVPQSDSILPIDHELHPMLMHMFNNIMQMMVQAASGDKCAVGKDIVANGKFALL